MASWARLKFEEWGELTFAEEGGPTRDPLEPAIRALLLADENVEAIIGARVYIGERPADERRACVVIHITEEDDEHTLDSHDGYVQGTAQIQCLAPTAKEARLLAIASRWALDSKDGEIAGCTVDWLHVEGSREIPAAPLDGESIPTHGVTVDLDFQYQA